MNFLLLSPRPRCIRLSLLILDGVSKFRVGFARTLFFRAFPDLTCRKAFISDIKGSEIPHDAMKYLFPLLPIPSHPPSSRIRLFLLLYPTLSSRLYLFKSNSKHVKKTRHLNGLSIISTASRPCPSVSLRGWRNTPSPLSYVDFVLLLLFFFFLNGTTSADRWHLCKPHTWFLWLLL
jgi:hypothetical protein